MSGGLHLGMVIPSSNSVVETIMPSLTGPGNGVHVHYSRFPAPGNSIGEVSYDAMPDAAALLIDAEVTSLAFCGTAGAWLGIDQDQALCRAFEGRGARITTTATLAVLEALRSIGVAEIGLVVPGPSALAERVGKVFREAGVKVGSAQGLGIADNLEVARVGRPQLHEAVSRVAETGTEAVVILGTNLDGSSVALDAQDRLGLPVIDSGVATLWHLLSLSGVKGEMHDLLTRQGLASHV